MDVCWFLCFRKPDSQQKPANTEKVQCQFTDEVLKKIPAVEINFETQVSQSLFNLMTRTTQYPVLIDISETKNGIRKNRLLEKNILLFLEAYPNKFFANDMSRIYGEFF